MGPPCKDDALNFRVPGWCCGPWPVDWDLALESLPCYIRYTRHISQLFKFNTDLILQCSLLKKEDKNIIRSAFHESNVPSSKEWRQMTEHNGSLYIKKTLESLSLLDSGSDAKWTKSFFLWNWLFFYQDRKQNLVGPTKLLHSMGYLTLSLFGDGLLSRLYSQTAVTTEISFLPSPQQYH